MSLTDEGARYEVRQELTSILKVYNGFARLMVLKEPFVFHRYDYDPMRVKLDGDKKKKSTESPEEIELRSQWRAKTKIVDLAMANDFDLFVTFTFDPKKVDRYDVDYLKKLMGYWLNNQRRLHGASRYIITAEYHKDGAIHFHALLGGYKGAVVDRGHIDPKDGRKKYDLDSFRLGIARAKKIDLSLDDHQKVAEYVSKYITKDMPKFHGRQRYWCSNGLKMPLKVLNPALTEADKQRFTKLPGKDTKVEVFEFRGEFTDAELARFAVYGTRREDDLTAWEL